MTLMKSLNFQVYKRVGVKKSINWNFYRFFTTNLKTSITTGPTTTKYEEYGSVESDYNDQPIYPEDVPSIYDYRSLKRIAHGRKILKEIIRDLPSIEEKIFTVNPYERSFTNFEMRRYRQHQRPMKAPRKAFGLPPVPTGYDSLNMYKYVTNTYSIPGLPEIYDSIVVTENQQLAFKEQLMKLIKIELNSQTDTETSVASFIQSMGDGICCLFADEKPYLRASQIGINTRYESFLERGGFGHLYSMFSKKSKRRLTTDNVYRIGELAFTFKDTANLQIRSDLPLPTFIDATDPLVSTPVAEFKYFPTVYNSYIIRDPLWMSPGFEEGDPCQFGSLMVNSMKNLRKTIDGLWQAEEPEFHECLQSMAISSCFSWLNAQAHFQGFTQYTDILYPFTTQAIFTDGRLFYFAAYQLNTLDLLHDFEGKNTPKTNLCWFEGPFALYESLEETNGRLDNLNDVVVEKILKFVYNEPQARKNVDNYAPYVTVVERPDFSELEKIEANIKSQANIRYTV